MPEEMKSCSRCKTEKPLWHYTFVVNNQRHCWCMDCRARYSQINSMANRYGVAFDWYEDKLKRQNEVCAICRKSCQTGRLLGVDHNHKTGKPRELLCMRCNIVLGHVMDDPELLRKAAAYLEKHRNV